MPEFEVTVSTDRARESYRIHSNRHDDQCTHVAWIGLRSFEQHGHAKFPYADEALTVEVKPVPAENGRT